MKVFDAVVRKSLTVLRKKPADGGECQDECFSGMGVSILERSGDFWARIETFYGYVSWVRTEDLWTGDAAAAWQNSGLSQVASHTADVLVEPAYRAPRLETLFAGSRLALTGRESEGWSETMLAGGASGWIRTNFTAAIPEPDVKRDEEGLRNRIVAAAFGFLGTQYRWGGKTSAGIDCSGLCSLAYLLNGLVIYRDSVFKEESLREVTPEELKPADLLYCPGHMALYLGNGKIIHSTGALSGVIVNSLKPGDADYRPQVAENILHRATIFR